MHQILYVRDSCTRSPMRQYNCVCLACFQFGVRGQHCIDQSLTESDHRAYAFEEFCASFANTALIKFRDQ